MPEVKEAKVVQQEPSKQINLLVVSVDSSGVSNVAINRYDAAKNNQLVHLNAQLQDATFYESGVAIEAALNGIFFGRADMEFHVLWSSSVIDDSALGHMMALYVWYSQGMGPIGEDDQHDPVKQAIWDDLCQQIGEALFLDEDGCGCGENHVH